MYQYKVLTQKDRFFSGKFSPEKLQTVINDFAEDGWRVVSVTSADFPGMMQHRNEIVVVLEKERA